jgi:1-acyl-sn-glycerol-3-phosphate acyltransferase
VALGLFLTAAVIPLASQRQRDGLRQWWAGRLLRVLGLRVRHVGGELGRGTLVVANHVSWLDVFAINALAPTTFVCKTEVRRWPAIGWMVARNDTLFLERGRHRAAAALNKQLRSALDVGRTVVLFPEGTSSDGRQVLPFHAALLQPAIDGGCAIVPLCMRYRDGSGRYSEAPAYCADIGFVQSLRAIAASPSLVTEIHVLPAVSGEGTTRREAAERARAAIDHRLAHSGAGGAPDFSCSHRDVTSADTHPLASPNRAPAAFLRA